MHLIVFSDTYENVNGVSTIYRDLLSWASGRDNLSVSIVTPSKSTRIEHGVNSRIHYIKPRIDLTPRAYPEFTTGLFRLSDVEYLLDTPGEKIVHIATQGPYGILGQRFAKKHGLATTGYYHTDFRRYLEIYGAKMFPVFGLGRRAGTFVATTMNRLAYGPTSEMFVQSKEYISEIDRFHKGNATVVPSGVNTVLFSPPSPPEKRGGNLREKYLGDHDHLAIFVGRVAAEKNLSAIMRQETFFKERNIKVVFVGDGPFTGEVRKKSGIPVTGYLFKEDLADAYRSADLFLFPSLTDTYGMVLLEAMGTGLPIICNVDTAPAAIVGNADAGVACDFADAASIGGAIDHLTDPQVWAACSANGIRYADENSLDHSLDTLIARMRAYAR